MENISTTIGIADDDQGIRSYIKGILSGIGFQVKEYKDTSEVKMDLRKNPESLSLLILDHHFGPGETGIEALPKIREYDGNLPIILLTALDNDLDIDVAELYGVTYHHKPIDDVNLRRIVKAQLEKQDELKPLIEYQKHLETEIIELKKSHKLDNIDIPDDVKLFVANLFKRLTLSSKAISELSCNKANDELLNILKSLNSNQKIIPGVRSRVWHKEEDAMEYYFSGSGRVIVIFDKAEKPFVKNIFFHHEHTK